MTAVSRCRSVGGPKQLLAHVKPEQIDAVRQRRVKEVEHTTADKDLGVLKAFFNWDKTKPLLDEQGRAVEKLEQVRYNDMLGPYADKSLFLMGKVKFFNTSNERVRYLQDDEWERLYQAALALEDRSPHLADKMVLARNIGLRRTNLFRAECEWLDFRRSRRTAIESIRL